MVLHRMREHVVAHNWFAVGIDLGIVVLGVLIAAQVSNWNENRLDQRKAHAYHDRLIDELKITEQSMRALRLYNMDARDHGLATLAVLQTPTAPAGEAFLVSAYSATQVFPRSARHSIYDEAAATGSIELIGTPDLRARLSNFYWRMDGLVAVDASSPPYRERLRTVMPYAVQRAIRVKCDEIITDLGNGLMSPRLPKQCSAGLDPAKIGPSVAAIRAEPKLGDDLGRLLSTLDARILTFTKLEDNARQLRQYMEQQDH